MTAKTEIYNFLVDPKAEAILEATIEATIKANHQRIKDLLNRNIWTSHGGVDCPCQGWPPTCLDCEGGVFPIPYADLGLKERT